MPESEFDFFKPFLDEGFAALKDVAKKLGGDAKWYLDRLARIEADARDLVEAINDPTTDVMAKAQLAEVLRTLIPDRKVFLLAAAEAQAGSEAQAILDVALDITGRLLASAVRHYLL